MEQISKAIDIRRAGRELYGLGMTAEYLPCSTVSMELLAWKWLFRCRKVWRSRTFIPVKQNKLNINLIKDLQAVAILLEVKK